MVHVEGAEPLVCWRTSKKRKESAGKEMKDTHTGEVLTEDDRTWEITGHLHRATKYVQYVLAFSLLILYSRGVRCYGV